jgi:hypothetical protein
MGARILERGAGLVGQLVDGFLALREQVQELEAPGAGEGVADAGELTVEGVLEGAVRHGYSLLI